MYFGSVVVLKRTGGDGSVFPVCTSETLLGRGDRCHVRLQLPEASRNHCKIVIQQDKKARLVCLDGIVGGTFHDGRPLAAGEEVGLGHRDHFGIVDRRFRWEYPDGSDLAESPPAKKKSVGDREARQVPAAENDDRERASGSAIQKNRARSRSLPLSSKKEARRRDPCGGPADFPSETADTQGSTLFSRKGRREVAFETSPDALSAPPGSVDPPSADAASPITGGFLPLDGLLRKERAGSSPRRGERVDAAPSGPRSTSPGGVRSGHLDASLSLLEDASRGSRDGDVAVAAPLSDAPAGAAAAENEGREPSTSPRKRRTAKRAAGRDRDPGRTKTLGKSCEIRTYKNGKVTKPTPQKRALYSEILKRNVANVLKKTREVRCSEMVGPSGPEKKCVFKILANNSEKRSRLQRGSNRHAASPDSIIIRRKPMGAVKPARPQRVVLRHVKSGPFGVEDDRKTPVRKKLRSDSQTETSRVQGESEKKLDASSKSNKRTRSPREREHSPPTKRRRLKESKSPPRLDGRSDEVGITPEKSAQTLKSKRAKSETPDMRGLKKLFVERKFSPKTPDLGNFFDTPNQKMEIVVKDAADQTEEVSPVDDHVKRADFTPPPRIEKKVTPERANSCHRSALSEAMTPYAEEDSTEKPLPPLNLHSPNNAEIPEGPVSPFKETSSLKGWMLCTGDPNSGEKERPTSKPKIPPKKKKSCVEDKAPTDQLTPPKARNSCENKLDETRSPTIDAKEVTLKKTKILTLDVQESPTEPSSKSFSQTDQDLSSASKGTKRQPKNDRPLRAKRAVGRKLMPDETLTNVLDDGLSQTEEVELKTPEQRANFSSSKNKASRTSKKATLDRKAKVVAPKENEQLSALAERKTKGRRKKSASKEIKPVLTEKLPPHRGRKVRNSGLVLSPENPSPIKAEPAPCRRRRALPTPNLSPGKSLPVECKVPVGSTNELKAIRSSRRRKDPASEKPLKKGRNKIETSVQSPETGDVGFVEKRAIRLKRGEATKLVQTESSPELLPSPKVLRPSRKREVKTPPVFSPEEIREETTKETKVRKAREKKERTLKLSPMKEPTPAKRSTRGGATFKTSTPKDVSPLLKRTTRQRKGK